MTRQPVNCLKQILSLQARLPTVRDIYYPRGLTLEHAPNPGNPEHLPFRLHKLFNDLPQGVYSVFTVEDLSRVLAVIYAWLSEGVKPNPNYTLTRLLEALQHPELPSWNDYDTLTHELETLLARCRKLTTITRPAGNCPYCWQPIQTTTRTPGSPGFLECVGCHHTWPNHASLTDDRLFRVRHYDQPGITITWPQLLDIWQPYWSRKTLEKHRRQGLLVQHQGGYDLAQVNASLLALIS